MMLQRCVAAVAGCLLMVGCSADPDPTPTETPTPLPDSDGDGVADGLDCNPTDASIYAGAAEDGGAGTSQGDGKDNNCNGIIDEGTRSYDDDGDTFSEDGTVGGAPDCNDGAADQYPGAGEIPYDGIDQDCDGFDLIDLDEDGYPSDQVEGGTDCDDSRADISPEAPEDGGTGSNLGDDVDNNCDGQIDEGMLDTDDDGDGVTEISGDCDDADPSLFPANPEIPYDGIDQNCDQLDEADVDDDGHCAAGLTLGEGVPYPYELAACQVSTSDCDDTTPTTFPGAPELCNAVDDNCDEVLPAEEGATLYYADSDGDGYGDVSVTLDGLLCAVPSGYVGEDGDCDDGDAAISPAAEEICNGLDDNCDAFVSNSEGTINYYLDADFDGFGAGEPTEVSGPGCAPPDGYSNNADDCDDGRPAVNPDGVESCDGLDGDCDGSLPPGEDTVNYYTDGDQDGYGDDTGEPTSTGLACATPPEGQVTLGGDCDDGDAAVGPLAEEQCNGEDDNCDGAVPEGEAITSYYTDGDGDGYGAAGSSESGLACAPSEGLVSVGGDCDDANPGIRPGASEACNGIDDNCDGQLPGDEQVGNYFFDADGDGAGGTAAEQTGLLCQPPAGLSSSPDDCNDADATIYPGAPERCDGSDADCDAATTGSSDVDQDGFPACGEDGAVLDCHDADETIHPGRADWRDDGIDNNCDATVDGTTLASRLSLFLYGEESNAKLGGTLAGAVDLDGDGIDELIVGAEKADVVAGQDGGRAYVLAGGIPPEAARPISEEASFIDGVKSFDFFATSVALAPDLSGDGLPDLVVGAPQHDKGGSNRGAVYLFFGREGRFDADLSAAEADALIYNTSSDLRFGVYVQPLADFNGDGVGDLAVSAGEGRVALFLGGQDLADRTDETADLLLTGGTSDDLRLAAGDINDDGRTDLVVGDPTTSSNAGKLYVYFGRSTLGNPEASLSEGANLVISGQSSEKAGLGMDAGKDLNGDGIEDLIVSTGDNRGRLYFFAGRDSAAWTGVAATSAATATLTFPTSTNTSTETGARMLEDVTGDGLPELAFASPGLDNAGTVYVVAGRTSGFVADSSTFDGAAGAVLILKGAAADQLGRGGSITSLGDWLGGSSGLAIGAFGADQVGTDLGQVLLIEGR